MTRSLPFSLLLASLAAVTTVVSVSAEEKASKLEAYRAARVVTVAGDDFAPGVLLVRDGKVEAVQPADKELPKDAKLTDLGDAVLMPGLVDPLSALNQGTGSGRASQSNGGPTDGRRLTGHTGVDLKNSLFRRLGRTGYTSFTFVPNRATGMIAGQASVLRPAHGGEKEPKELVVAESVYLLLGYESGKSWRDAGVKYWKKAVDDIIKAREAKKKAAEEAKKKAEEAKKKAEEAKKTGGDAKKPTPKPPTPPTPGPPARGASPPTAPTAAAKKSPPKPPDPLMELFEGKRRAFLRVRDPAAYDHLFAFLDSLELKIKFVLVTTPQTPEIVDRIIERRKQIEAVVLEPRMGTLWETSIWVNTARLFLRAGVDVAFVPLADSIDGHRDVFFHLAEMVKSGVLPEEALRGVTTVPAKIIGLEGKIGALTKGASANFTVYDRDPLGGGARLLSVYVEGTRVFNDDPKTGEISGEAIR